MAGPAEVERFWKHVELQLDGCWLWNAATDKDGYGYFKIGSYTDGTRKMVRAHRFIWEQIHGDIPKGMQLHHTCENAGCINPEHLELVTPKEHTRKSPNSITYAYVNRTHCERGHEFTPENTYAFRGARLCRECRRINWRKHEAKLKQNISQQK